ncbi:hypothetical protein ACFFGH_32680 [Lysobacter korlensis]|uniref:Transmembrane protein n=1 Tax=Lysobacter korlensis TaxID=553636 RepID=A0ABV6S056_9GAMM
MRLAVAVGALWFAGVVCFVLWNRYRYGSDFDSIPDLLLLGLALPAAAVALVASFWVLGARGSKYLLSALALVLACSGGLYAYNGYQARQEAEREKQERAEYRASLERQFGAECEAERRRPVAGVVDPYTMCLVAREMAQEQGRRR